jgi:hypothetical protein
LTAPDADPAASVADLDRPDTPAIRGENALPNNVTAAIVIIGIVVDVIIVGVIVVIAAVGVGVA